MIGTVLGNRYAIVSEKHKTDFAHVYVANDAVLGSQPVLLKLFSNTSEVFRVERIRNEKTGLMRVRAHPWFPSLIDILHLHGNREALVVDVIHGMSIQEALDRTRGPEPMTLERALPIAIKIVQAVGFAARNGIFHRNLSNETVIITNDPLPDQVKIIDFSRCGVHDSGKPPSFPPLDDAGDIPFPAFKAPEVIRDPNGDYDPFLADIYSTGCIVYGLVCGRAPFASSTSLDALRKQIEKGPPRPTAIDPTVSAQLEATILRAIDKDPARRFQTAEEFEQELVDAQRAR